VVVETDLNSQVPQAFPTSEYNSSALKKNQTQSFDSRAHVVVEQSQFSNDELSQTSKPQH